jgi:aspartate carbamoyltransferase catalytic subunit
MKANFQKINNCFKNKSFIAIDQLAKISQIKKIFQTADQMKKIVEKKKPSQLLKGYCIAELFYQPSTRTFTSFLAASKWLGAMTIPIHGMNAYSSAVKGETIEDTVRSINQTTGADLIIMRHPENDSAERAAKASYVPVINAGSGKKEHPTQAVLDLYL